MDKRTRAIIVGWGNIGKGVYTAIKQNSDMRLVGIISRRPEKVSVKNVDVKRYSLDNLNKLTADVAILCGGSATDLPTQGPTCAKFFNTVDSFDTHAKIPEYYATMDEAAKNSGNVAVISTGWDPGTFSLERVLADAFLPGSEPAGFYGLSKSGGLSMGHSDAIRRVEGVTDARQYTHAIPETIERAKKGKKVSSSEMHWRECVVVAEKDADKIAIEKKIVNMPNYFAPYKTTVKFVTQEVLDRDYSSMPHDGIVIATALMGNGKRGVIEYQNQWDSNPDATANILVAHARAAHKLSINGNSGAFTILDIPPAFLSPRNKIELLENFM